MSAQSKHGGAKVNFPPPLIYVLLTIVGAVLQRFVWPLAIPLSPLILVLAGVWLALAGIWMAVSARMWFSRTGQDPKPWKPSPELIVKGIYRYTRNPMYIGMTLVQLGLGLGLGNGWIMLLALDALLVVHIIAVRPEEAYLTEKFGESYTRYKASVRRYL